MTFAFLGNMGDSYHHKFLIREIVRLTGCETYLELGVYDGETLDWVKGGVKQVYAVDCVDIRKEKVVNGPGYSFFEMKTDEFFEKFPELRFDIAFIDADHSFESAKKDFLNVLERLNKYGCIICHDSDPINEFYTAPGYCGDSYKLVDYIYENHPELNIITLPVTETGISIIMRKHDRRAELYKGVV